MVFDAEDMAQFTDPDMPAHTVVKINGVDVSGNFVGAYVDTFGVISGNEMTFSANPADVADVKRKDILVMNDTVYSITKIERGGLGLTRIIFEKS